MRSLPDEFVQELLDELEQCGKDHAVAKSKLRSMEENRKIEKARLMGVAEAMGWKSGAKQEAYAYSNVVYGKQVKDLVSAVEAEAATANRLKYLELRFEAWRTVNANMRSRGDR